MIKSSIITSIINDVFEKYKNEFEINNYIELVPRLNTINMFLATVDLFMPKFVIYDKHILLRENVEEVKGIEEVGEGKYCHDNARKSGLIKPHLGYSDSVNFEQLNNLFSIGDFLGYNQEDNFSDLMVNDDVLATMLSSVLAFFWDFKLKDSYPNRKFKVEVFEDGVQSEDLISLTFWQVNNIYDSKLVSHKIDKILNDEITEWYRYFHMFGDFHTSVDLYSSYESIFSVAYLLFPEIISYDNCILLKSNIEKYEKIKSKNERFEFQYIKTGKLEIKSKLNENKKTIEQFNNLINISKYFSYKRYVGKIEDEGYNDIRLIEKVIEILKYFWKVRLKDLFPDKNFKVEMLDSPFDQEGLCVTFWEDIE